MQKQFLRERRLFFFANIQKVVRFVSNISVEKVSNRTAQARKILGAMRDKLLSMTFTKQLTINGIGGLTVIVVTWLMTFNNYFVFGLATLLVYGLLLIIFYFLTTQFKWHLTIFNFLVCVFMTNWVVDTMSYKHPDLEIFDQENFPYANYFNLSAIICVVSKTMLELIFKTFVGQNLQVTPKLGRLLYSSVDKAQST